MAGPQKPVPIVGADVTALMEQGPPIGADVTALMTTATPTPARQFPTGTSAYVQSLVEHGPDIAKITPAQTASGTAMLAAPITGGLSIPAQMAAQGGVGFFTRLASELGAGTPVLESGKRAVGEGVQDALLVGAGGKIQQAAKPVANWLMRTAIKPLRSLISHSGEAALGLPEAERQMADRFLATRAWTAGGVKAGREAEKEALEQKFTDVVQKVTTPVSPKPAARAMDAVTRGYAKAGLAPEAQAASAATQQFREAPAVTQLQLRPHKAVATQSPILGPNGQPIPTTTLVPQPAVRILRPQMTAAEGNLQRRAVDRELGAHKAYGQYVPGRTAALKAQTGAWRNELATVSPEAARLNKAWSQAILDTDVLDPALARIAHQNPVSFIEGVPLVMSQNPARALPLLINRAAFSVPLAQGLSRVSPAMGAVTPQAIRALYLALLNGEPPQ